MADDVRLSYVRFPGLRPTELGVMTALRAKLPGNHYIIGPSYHRRSKTKAG